jgi:hypothetical protein
MAANKIAEGVMGGVMAMPAINRIMQLAGLEHSGSLLRSETQLAEAALFEEEAGDMLDKLAASAADMPEYKDNPEAARIYAAGALLSSIAKSMTDAPPQTVAGQALAKTIQALGPMGANAIKVASDIAAKTPDTTAGQAA